MTMPEITDANLISKLLRATKKKKIGWEITATKDRFAASYGGKWTLTVDKSPNEDTGSTDYYLTITDAEGQEVFRIWDQPNNDLPALFEQARRNALKVDEAL